MSKIKIKIWLIVLLLAITPLSSLNAEDNTAQFQIKLSSMLERINKSVEILRAQILNNQNAPFLPDLYLQLGNLLTKKANVLYYIQMERQGSEVPAEGGKQKFKAVTDASIEAIRVYQTIANDFKSYDKIPKVLYLLSVSYHSIGETAKFMAMSEKLTRTYPESTESLRVRLLLGKHYFDEEEYEDAEEALEPVTESNLVYERNRAKYYLGVLYLRLERYKSALMTFEEIILDEELDDEDSPRSVSLKTSKISSSLKREALIDSIKAFTHVFPDHKNPVQYYAQLAPTEILFQEVIEKLAFRQINLKKYQSAINLLRALSERTRDPEKVVNIYQEVLTMVPLHKRLDIKVDEISYVLEKFNIWFSYFKLTPEMKKTAYRFLEIQLREFGTKSHDMAKKMKGSEKEIYLKRAAEFYRIYLGFFPNSENKVKVATNLADTYFLLKKFPESGSYYLRIAEDEFGKPKEKDQLLDNALLILQKDGEYSYYEQFWRRGLLISAIKKAFELNEMKKKDQKLNFILAKTYYEQALYDTALTSLYDYMRNYPAGEYVEDAGELILSYFNEKGDYEKLNEWANKLLSLNLKDPKFTAKIDKIKMQAKVKSLDKTIRNTEGYDELQQGKSYYKFAQQSTDIEVKSVAMQQALQKSRDEKDVRTFFKVANSMASGEKDGKKLLAIYLSIANESIYLARYYTAIDALMKIVNGSFEPNSKLDAFMESINIGIALKDFSLLKGYVFHPLWNRLAEKVKNRVVRTIADAIESPLKMDDQFARILLKDDRSLAALFKARYKFSPSIQSEIESRVSSLCKGENGNPTCLWSYLNQLDSTKVQFIAKLEKASVSPDEISTYGNEFFNIQQSYQRISNSEDIQLEMLIAIRNIELYGAFAMYLQKVANSNPEISGPLTAKVDESLRTRGQYVDFCSKIQDQSPEVVKTRKYCSLKSGVPSIDDVLKWPKQLRHVTPEKNDSENSDILAIQKSILGNGKNAENYLKMGEIYLEKKKFHHAAATAMYGMSFFNEQKDKFYAIIGCGALKLGLVSEAKYYLNQASDYEDLTSECLEELKDFEE